MRKVILAVTLLFCTLYTFGQSNTGTPYSMYGVGLVPDNYGPYTAMGGVGVAMRDNSNINFLNPASYTALDSNRFYFQLGITGEYVSITTHKESSDYRVAQNASLNMALRLYKNLYSSFGFNERSDIGYDLLYTNFINGDKLTYNEHSQGEGGLNDIYLGLGYKLGNLSVGLNSTYVFGKLERRQTLLTQLANSYYINSSNNISVNGFLFQLGLQYGFNLSSNSKLTLGATANLTTKFNADKTFTSYKVNSATGATQMLVDRELNEGNINYPLRLSGGFNYDYKDKWNIAGDYTYQKFSDYEEFGENQNFKDYHREAIGVSYLPARYGRYWVQRNKYMIGAYATQSHIALKSTRINTYGVTLGTQIPVFIPGRELLLGIAFDLGLRGTETNGLIQEKYAKVRINIAFKEGWFMKRKIE